MTVACHNLSYERGSIFSSEYNDVRSLASTRKNTRLAARYTLSNPMRACYITRAVGDPRRTNFRGMEQPGSSSGS